MYVIRGVVSNPFQKTKASKTASIFPIAAESQRTESGKCWNCKIAEQARCSLGASSLLAKNLDSYPDKGNRILEL